MTTEQIKNTELTSQDIVSRSLDVFAKESSLATAKDIQGLRAIFEEVSTKCLGSYQERFSSSQVFSLNNIVRTLGYEQVFIKSAAGRS